MRFEKGPELLSEVGDEGREKDKKRKLDKKNNENEEKGTGKWIGKIVGRAALGAAVGMTMLPGSKDAPQKEFDRTDVPPDRSVAPVPHGFDVPSHPEKGLMENLPPGVERRPEQPAEEPATPEEPRQEEVRKIGEGEIVPEEEALQQQAEETPEIREKEIFEPRVSIVDAGLEAPKEGIHQEAFPSNEEMVRRVLGDQYISKEQLREEFGEDFNQKWGEIVQKYPAAMMHAFGDSYFRHGKGVAEVMHGIWDKMGMKGKNVELIPLQSIFDKKSVEFVQDSLGNRGISVTFDEERIIELLKEDTNRVVNLSFQVGDIQMSLEKWRKEMPAPEPYGWFAVDKEGVSTVDEESIDKIYVGEGGSVGVGLRGKEDGTLAYIDIHGNEIQPMTREEFKGFQNEKQKQAQAYEDAPAVEVENPTLEIKGAYTEEKAVRNLVRLFEICHAYPRKLFVAAGGSNAEDIREAREQLKKQWPDNLIFVGQWREGVDSSGPVHDVHGMDIYVKHGETMPEGSTYSTAALSAFVEASLKRLSLAGEWSEIREELKKTATPQKYTINGVPEKALVLREAHLIPSRDFKGNRHKDI